MHENRFGLIVRKCWHELRDHYSGIGLDEFVIMPNHIHGIVLINDDILVKRIYGIVGAGLKPAPTTTITKRHGLPEIVRAFKTFSARRINEMQNTTGLPVWQRDYWEHVGKNDKELNRIRQYIIDNPRQWVYDDENPDRPHQPVL